MPATPPRRSPDRLFLPFGRHAGRLIIHRIARRIAPLFRSPTAFPTTRSPDRSPDLFQYLTCSALSCVKSHHLLVFILFTLQAFLSWTQDFIAPSNLHHNLGRIARRIARHISHYFHSSTAFPTVRVPWCSTGGASHRLADRLAERSLLPLVNGFRDGSRTVSLVGRSRRFARRSACRMARRIARWIARLIARRMARRIAQYFRSSMAFPSVRAQDCKTDGRADRTLVRTPDRSADRSLFPLVDGFPDGSHTVSHIGWQIGSLGGLFITSARRRLSRRFARRITRRMAHRLVRGFPHIFSLLMARLTFHTL